jgi:hypothetical protein
VALGVVLLPSGAGARGFGLLAIGCLILRQISLRVGVRPALLSAALTWGFLAAVRNPWRFPEVWTYPGVLVMCVFALAYFTTATERWHPLRTR